MPLELDCRTVTIVGKGPSIEHLRAEHLSEVVIAINHAIEVVEPIADGIVISLQKEICTLPGCDTCTAKVRPADTTTLIAYDARCFPDHPNRIALVLDDYDMPQCEMSVMFAVAIAKQIGVRIRMVGFDSLNGDFRTWSREGSGLLSMHGHYGAVTKRLKEALEGIEHEWVYPSK